MGKTSIVFFSLVLSKIVDFEVPCDLNLTISVLVIVVVIRVIRVIAFPMKFLLT